MRAILRDVVRHPTWLPDWWADLPLRDRWWWREVLFERGQGWLCWAPDLRNDSLNGDPAFEGYVYPPARRLWEYVRWWLLVPYRVVIGHRDPYVGGRYRWPWRDALPSWRQCWGMLIDSDRRRLWNPR